MISWQVAVYAFVIGGIFGAWLWNRMVCRPMAVEIQERRRQVREEVENCDS